VELEAPVVQSQREALSEIDGNLPRVIILSGPTGCGKTELSLILAKLIGGEVISADSMQIYRGMDIGTAKACEEEQALVHHHLLDIRDVSERFTVVDFFYEAKRAVESILARGRVPIFVGGSGFYIRTLLYGPPQGPASVPELREELEEELQIHGVEALYDQLQKLDPEYASRITCNDKQKVVRALEIIALTSNTVSSLSWGMSKRGLPFDCRCWFLYRPREVIYERIEERCEQMIDRGLIEEVEHLQKIGLEENLSASQAIGYKQTLKFLQTEQTDQDKEEYLQRFRQASRRYAKRQFTWFRKEPLFRWLDIELHDTEIAAEMVAQDYRAL
jgi:tRNA dimethylallyltransferase